MHKQILYMYVLASLRLNNREEVLLCDYSDLGKEEKHLFMCYQIIYVNDIGQ